MFSCAAGTVLFDPFKHDFVWNCTNKRYLHGRPAAGKNGIRPDEFLRPMIRSTHLAIAGSDRNCLSSVGNCLAFILRIIILGVQFSLRKNDYPRNSLIGGPAMARRVVIDTEECIGCESCVELCGEVFAFNEEEEKAQVIMPEGGPEDCIEEAIETCPVECIHWED
jgi:ferredoxin